MNDKLSQLYLFVIISFLSLSCTSPYRSLLAPRIHQIPKQVLFKDISVFTGLTTSLNLHQDVLIGDGKILAIGPTGTIKAKGASLISGEGKTLLPGFIDTHVHVSFSGSAPFEEVSPDPIHNLHAYLYSGITTIYDLGGRASDLQSLRKKVNNGEILGPRIFHTHIPITVPNSHPLPITQKVLPWPLGTLASLLIPQIHNIEDVNSVIDGVIEREVDYVKLTADQLPPGTPEMSDIILKAAIERVNKQGLKAVIHIGGIDKALVAAKAGAAALVHHTWRTNISQQEAEELSKTGVYYMATLAGWEVTAAMAKGQFNPSKLAREIMPKQVITSVSNDLGKRILDVPSVGDMCRTTVKMEATWHPSIKRLYNAGIRFLIGTDSGVPGVFPGSSFHDELESLSKAGVPNAELLIAATSRGAKWFNSQANFGTIEVGKVADLVVVEGNPLLDITVTTKLQYIFLRGHEINRILPDPK